MKYPLVVRKVNAILDDYPGMKLTLRQIFYRLVAEHGYPNTKSKYSQLSTQLVKARQTGDVDEDRIEDRTRQFIGEDYGWESYDAFVSNRFSSFFNSPLYYGRKMWTSQPEFVIVWIEKDALSTVVSTIAKRYNVITCPSRGYASYTYIKEALELLPKDKEITILHFADHDPSGIDMTRDLISRFSEYTNQTISVERIALNYDQTQEYALPPNPTKTADPRFASYLAEYGPYCWELDAIEPTELQRLVTQAIEKHIDFEQWTRIQTQEEQENAELETMFSEIKNLLTDNGYDVPPV